MFIAKLLDPKNDYVFKRIFGYVGNEDITKNLLNSILDIQVDEVRLDCKEILEQDLKTDKFGVLDIKAVLNQNMQCNIEMQMVDRKDIESRLLFYWSKMYNKQIKIGEEYNELEKTICVLIVNYEIDNLKDYDDFISKWMLFENKYRKFILTNILEIYILELPKFEKYVNESKNKALNTWVRFLNNPEVIDMDNENNEELKKAKEVLDTISADEHEQYLAEQRLIYIMDQKAIHAAGYDKGYKAGHDKGHKLGIIETARKMLENNVDIDIIISCTDLTKDEIEKLKD